MDIRLWPLQETPQLIFKIHEMFFSLEHLASLIFFFQQKNLEVNMLFFHGCFRVYRIEVGNETLIAKKVVIVKMQQYELKLVSRSPSTRWLHVTHLQDNFAVVSLFRCRHQSNDYFASCRTRIELSSPHK